MDLAEEAGAVTPEGSTGKFQPSVLFLLRPIEAYEEDPDNVRLHPEENLLAISSSLESFGQTKPVVYRVGPSGRLTLVAGNGTYRCAKALGWTHLAGVEFSGQSRIAKAYAIADNKIPELATWDQAKLDAQLIELSREWNDELDWMANTSGLVAEYEAPTAEKTSDREPKRPELADDLPVAKVEVATAAETPAAYACADCGSKETVCAKCVTEQLVDPLLALRAAMAKVDELAVECWLKPEQVKAVVEAIQRRAGETS